MLQLHIILRSALRNAAGYSIVYMYDYYSAKGGAAMVARIFSAGLSGIDGYIVTVECFLSGGLPRLDVVGLPTGAVSEAGRARARRRQGLLL